MNDIIYIIIVTTVVTEIHIVNYYNRSVRKKRLHRSNKFKLRSTTTIKALLLQSRRYTVYLLEEKYTDLSA